MSEEKVQETPNKEQNTPIKNFTSFDFKKILSSFQSIFSVFKNKNISGKLVVFLAVITFGLMIFLAFRLYTTTQDLKDNSSSLMNLSSYDTTILSNNRITKEVLDFSSTLYDLVQKNTEIKDSIVKYNEYMKDLQLPYTYFLRYLYLPSLNIWKDNYTNKIDTDIIGVNFLKNNPYNDVVLLQKRSTFFKNVGDNEFNDVSDISIGDITETDGPYFYIPIKVSFKANSKRSFLMLVDKLSLTSNQENISLINEFFYYLWAEIKKQKKTEIASLVNDYNSIFGLGAEEDLVIGYHLYHWIFDNDENVLIDASVLESTIKSLMFCSNLDMDQCYYEFRDKYRDLSTFAYAVSSDVSSNVVADFKEFFVNFPSILSLDDFTFDKVISTSLSDFNKQIYRGTVNIRVYGESVSQEEIDQIAGVLGEKCFGQEKNMSIQDALQLVDSAILQQSDSAGSDRSKTEDLWELRDVLDSINNEYESLSNYKKIIRLFELGRMLNDSGLCE